jgi:hypothetical protein
MLRFVLFRLTLLVRCVICLAFAWMLYGAAVRTLDAFVDWFRPFAIIDGALALALVPLVLAVSWGVALAALSLIDGVVSVGWGVVLHWWPGIPGFSVSAVLLSGLLSVLSGTIGLFQLSLAVELRRRSGSTVTGLAFGGMGAAFILLAILDFHLPVTPDTERKLLIAQMLLQALAFGAIALAVAPRTSYSGNV